MIKFSYNTFHVMETPDTYLAYPDKRIIGLLHCKKRQTTLCFNNISTFTFRIDKYVNQKANPHYDEISLGRYILFKDISWFRITDIQKKGDGKNEYAEVTCSSLEYETGQTYITALGQLGTDSDDDGGLDMYCLYSDIDRTHSLMHLFIEQNPSWSIGYVDPSISKEYRLFDEDRIDSYDMLVSLASETFECIFQFDTFDKTVSAYKLENLGEVTSIYLAYRNLIKTVNVSYSEDDVKTRFFVSGGTDVTNTALGIADVNPAGNNYITNYSYFYDDMSPELQARMLEYTAKMDENTPLYQEALSSLLSLYDDLAELQNAMPDDPDSTDWTKYGSVELKSKSQSYRNIMSLYSDDSSTSIYQDAYDNWYAINQELTKREAEIEAVYESIAKASDLVNSYVVNIYDFLGDDLYKELSVYNREDVFTDDSYIATEIMTDREVMDMQIALYEHAQEELAKVCFPQFTMQVDTINFPKIFRYKKYTDQLELGNIITINMSEHNNLEARLLKISINWDSAKDFSLTFSSKTSLDDGVFEFEYLAGTVDKISSSLNISSSGWNVAAKSSSTAFTDMSTFLNASLREVQNSTDNEVNIDNTGITIRRLESGDTYDPRQLWMTHGNIVLTNDGWKTVDIAIGTVTINGQQIAGIAAPLLLGTQIISENMTITNENNTLTLGADGFIAESSNGYKLTINPDTPNQIFTITYNGNTIMGVDAATGKFVFQGTIEATDGHIGGWTINETSLTSSNVGLASSGNVMIWAGGSSGSAPFRVSSDGSVYTSKIEVAGGTLKIGNNFSVDSSGNMTCSSATITGGSLTIGSRFSVDTSGNLKCSNADISGTITATAGKIGGFTIEDYSLVADSSKCQIWWGDMFIDGDEMYIADNVRIDQKYLAVNGGRLEEEESGYGWCSHWNGPNGTIFCMELYIHDDFWWSSSQQRYWSVSETVEYLWDKVESGDWGGCDYCDESDSGCYECSSDYGCSCDHDTGYCSGYSCSEACGPGYG